MNKSKIMLAAVAAHALLASAVVLGLASIPARAEEAPKDNKGYTVLKTVVIDLGAEIPSMAGWQLRLRTIKIEPGGHVGLHDHKDRPSVVVFQQGTDTVTNSDGSSKTFKAGDTVAEGVKAVHWHKNTGSDDVLFVVSDLLKNPAN
jgi:quercetin dioxygenase-like cupin family protein